MTNKEWLSTLSAEEWWDVINWLYHTYGMMWTDSRLAIMAWLEEEHKPITDVYSGKVRWE